MRTPEIQRRNKRLRWIAALAIALLLTAGGLVGWTIYTNDQQGHRLHDIEVKIDAAPGKKGSAGTAIKGATGARGARGRTGATGVAGPRGARGRAGARGPTGARGATGRTGAPGPRGARGPAGVGLDRSEIISLLQDVVGAQPAPTPIAPDPAQIQAAVCTILKGSAPALQC